MAEAQVGGVVALAGDDVIGLGDEDIHQVLRDGHAQVAVQLRVALVQVGAQEVGLVVLVHRVEGQVAEEVVVDVVGLGDLGDGIDTVLEHVQVLHVRLGGFRVLEEVLQGGYRVGYVRGEAAAAVTLGQGGAGALGDGVAVGLGDVGHELLAGVQVHVQVGHEGLEAGREAVHADQTAGARAGDGADVLAALLEDFREALVHALGQMGVLADAAGREAAVHAVVLLQDVGGLPEEGVTGRCQLHAGVLGGLQGLDYIAVGHLAAPVAAGAVPAVMADVEGLVSLGRLGVLDGQELVGMGVESGPLGEFLQELHHFRALCLLGGHAGGPETEE